MLHNNRNNNHWPKLPLPPLFSSLSSSFTFLFFFIVLLLVSVDVNSSSVSSLLNYQNQTKTRNSPINEFFSSSSSGSSYSDPLDPVFTLTIPRGDPNHACIKLNTSFLFSVHYVTRLANNANNGFILNRTVDFGLTEWDNFTYTGFCQPDRSMIELTFLKGWRLEMYFYKTKTGKRFLFNHAILFYKISGALFPGSMHMGAQAEQYDVTYVNSTLDRPFKCTKGIEMRLGEVTVRMPNFYLDPIFNRRRSSSLINGQQIKLPPAQCSADDPEPLVYNNLIWIVFISIFFALLVVCCVFFVFLKCKNSNRQLDSTSRHENKEYYNIYNSASSDEYQLDWKRRV